MMLSYFNLFWGCCSYLEYILCIFSMNMLHLYDETVCFSPCVCFFSQLWGMTGNLIGLA